MCDDPHNWRNAWDLIIEVYRRGYKDGRNERNYDPGENWETSRLLFYIEQLEKGIDADRLHELMEVADRKIDEAKRFEE